MSDLFGAIEAGVADTANFLMEAGKFGYDAWRQDQTWKREDNAVQRRVDDLKRAGLSPTLAAGSAASTSAPISVSAPRFDGANIMRSIEYQNAMKQGALTAAQKDLVDVQTQAKEAESFVDRMFADRLRSDASDPSHPGRKSFDLINSMYDKLIAENEAETRGYHDQVRNSDFARSQNLPVTPGALDAAIPGSMADRALKGSGPVISALYSVAKSLGLGPSIMGLIPK